MAWRGRAGRGGAGPGWWRGCARRVATVRGIPSDPPHCATSCTRRARSSTTDVRHRARRAR
ncbi:hypothetical protein GFH48_36930 [Streptomyces fagopyri]|uniref:Uncharacterized protein n=1 Tax=Streptomyces fagopyri TaxID=2662397 RepID=A0A5Q0LNP9_9ACTN|nr:hypothetical protein GFH48_36930 [Streptomyces fagopyri]